MKLLQISETMWINPDHIISATTYYGGLKLYPDEHLKGLVFEVELEFQEAVRKELGIEEAKS